MSNEADLEMLLEKRGFAICHFENMPFALQLQAIHSARVIVAPHGAGLANIVAAQKSTTLVEIISPDWFVTCYARLAVQLSLDYHYVETEIMDDGKRLIPLAKVLHELDRVD